MAPPVDFGAIFKDSVDAAEQGLQQVASGAVKNVITRFTQTPTGAALIAPTVAEQQRKVVIILAVIGGGLVLLWLYLRR